MSTAEQRADVMRGLFKDLDRYVELWRKEQAKVKVLEEALREQHRHVAANKTLPHGLCATCDVLFER